MKIACSSAAFETSLAGGGLTQLEWLDLAANELGADGVVFDERHFPRSDPDYLAQLKKTAVDLGLTVAGYAVGEVPEDPRPHLEVAQALGAPLAIVQAAHRDDDPAAWNACAAALRAAAAQAKALNVSLALRNLPGTLCASANECKLMAKDVDSAWLRFAFDATALERAELSSAPASKAILAIACAGDLAAFDAAAAGKVVELFGDFGGFVLLDASVSAGDREAYHRAVAVLRETIARDVLDRGARRALTGAVTSDG